MRSPARRLLGSLALAVLITLASAPVATAQTEEPPLVPSEDPEGRWSGSAFTAPTGDSPEQQPEIRVAGQFSYEKRAPGQRIIAATIEIAPDRFEPAPTCEVPPARPVPGDPPRESDYDMRRPATLAFDESGFRVTCNGRYLAHATAQLEDGTTWSMQVGFAVEVAPAQVEGVSAELDATERSVTITFTPLPLEARAPDAEGYLVERAGPDDEGFTEVARVPEDAEPTVVDDLGPAEPGRYVYRVRPLRRGAERSVPSDPDGAPTADVELEGDPTTSTTVEPEAERRSVARSTGGSRRVPAKTAPTRRSTARPTTPTTLDTGFEDTIDYGELPDGGDELAGDEAAAGQSIVQDEAGDGVDFAVPAAGALVLLGWAGHIVYLNRLAKLL